MINTDTAFILERFYQGWKVNSFLFTADRKLKMACFTDIDKDRTSVEGMRFEELPAYQQNVFWPLFQTAGSSSVPVVQMENDGIYFMAFGDERENTYIFGPVSTQKLSFSQQLQYRRRHGVANQNYMIPRLSFARAFNGLALVYYMITGRQVTEEQMMKANHGILESVEQETAVYEIKNTTEEKQHLAYKDELKWVQEIEVGIVYEKKERMIPVNIEKLEHIGTFSNQNSLKHFEYMAVTSACLASRAAIRGGLNAYEAYSLSEVFLQKISQCKDIMKLLQIHMQIAEEFSSRVRRIKEIRNCDCVEQCKDYIAVHRTEKFSLPDVAKAVGRNASYLSRIFSVQTGRTMQEYALDQRLEAAANMLRYSGESAGNVSEYLGFSSQSYFGERFRKKYGMTPADYRKNYMIRDF